jgi:GNAT superfamily N-acetyltransferase
VRLARDGGVTRKRPATKDDSEARRVTFVRKAAEADFDRIIDLYRQLQPGDPILRDGSDRAVFDEILRSPWLSLFVLEGDGGVQASCYLNVIPNITRSARPYAVIENVITDAAARRKGYGKRVVTHALEAAWAAGCYKVMLQTGSKREGTQAFYQACGFSGDAKHAFIARR